MKSRFRPELQPSGQKNPSWGQRAIQTRGQKKTGALLLVLPGPLWGRSEPRRGLPEASRGMSLSRSTVLLAPGRSPGALSRQCDTKSGAQIWPQIGARSTKLTARDQQLAARDPILTASNQNLATTAPTFAPKSARPGQPPHQKATQGPNQNDRRTPNPDDPS